MPLPRHVRSTASALHLLEQFALAHGITVAELLADAAAQGPSIPAWAFACERTPLETVVFALAEQGLSRKAIGAAIARPNSTVVNALLNAKQKAAAKKPSQPVKYSIPASVLRDTRLSPAEAVIVHLREGCALSNIATATLLGRDQRNTWQLYKSACKKRGGQQ